MARAAHPGSGSPFESALRACLLDAGIGGFVVQQPVELGFTARVDLGDPVRRIALEADGFAFHTSRAAFTRDCERYDELVRHGWLVLRFSWEQVMFDPEWVLAVVRDTRRLPGHNVTTTRPAAARAGRRPGLW